MSVATSGNGGNFFSRRPRSGASPFNPGLASKSIPDMYHDLRKTSIIRYWVYMTLSCEGRKNKEEEGPHGGSQQVLFYLILESRAMNIDQ